MHSTDLSRLLLVATDPHFYSSSGPDWKIRPTSLAAEAAGPYAARVTERTVLGERKGCYFECLMTKHLCFRCTWFV